MNMCALYTRNERIICIYVDYYLNHLVPGRCNCNEDCVNRYVDPKYAINHINNFHQDLSCHDICLSPVNDAVKYIISHTDEQIAQGEDLQDDTETLCMYMIVIGPPHMTGRYIFRCMDQRTPRSKFCNIHK